MENFNTQLISIKYVKIKAYYFSLLSDFSRQICNLYKKNVQPLIFSRRSEYQASHLYPPEAYRPTVSMSVRFLPWIVF